MSIHLPKLVQFAQELPTLQNDIQSAGTSPYQLREVCERMLTILGYLLHDRILDAYAAPAPPIASTSPAPKTPAAAPIPTSRPVLAPLAPRLPPGMPRLPPPPDVIVAAPRPILQNLPGDVPIQPGITNAFVTAGGTTVIAPNGARTTLPPGEAVPLTVSAGIPPELPEAPEGGVNVVLPPGGGMTPELEAALAGRSQDAPPK